MLVRPDERVPIARLLTFLEYGEHLAQDCARAQAALAPEQGMQRFLLSQARQEAAHAEREDPLVDGLQRAGPLGTLGRHDDHAEQEAPRLESRGRRRWRWRWRLGEVAHRLDEAWTMTATPTAISASGQRYFPILGRLRPSNRMTPIAISAPPKTSREVSPLEGGVPTS